MPNYCNNRVTISHHDHQMLARLVTAWSREALFQEFIACPEELLQETGAHPGWYNWRLDHWGTKWDVGDAGQELEISDNSMFLEFDTAWSPPRAVYAAWEDMGFTVEAAYYEPGMAFCGTWHQGSDTEYRIPDTADECRIMIPESLDSEFGISADLAYWTTQV